MNEEGEVFNEEMPQEIEQGPGEGLEVGFEDGVENLPYLNDEDQNIKDMLKVKVEQRFATGDRIQLDAFKIQKQVDIKRLKNKLWNHVEIGLNNRKHQTMTEVFRNLNKDGELVRKNVSIHSAFICMLHLANEKGLYFEENECDFMILN